MPKFKWLILRIPTLFFALGLIFDFEIIGIVITFVLLHVNLGLRQIIYDYVHVKKIKIFYGTSLQILTVEMSRHLLEFLI